MWGSIKRDMIGFDLANYASRVLQLVPSFGRVSGVVIALAPHFNGVGTRVRKIPCSLPFCRWLVERQESFPTTVNDGSPAF